MGEPYLKIDHLTVRYSGEKSNAVHNVSLALNAGESVGLIGESGSGKSSIVLAVMGLLERKTRISGSIKFKGTEISGMPENELSRYRWKRISVVFQNSLDVFNPVLTIGEQIAECIRRHTGISKASAMTKTKHYLDLVGLDAAWSKAYPHQLSGGMRQKTLIAMALSCEPDVLLVDEPTMALDSISKQEIIRLLMKLRDEKGFPMLIISHELPIIAAMTTRVMVMYAGNILEEGDTQELLKHPLHPYTRGLIYSSPAINPYRDMWGIPGEVIMTGEAQCPFYSRCNQRIERCAGEHPVLKAVCGNRRVSCIRGGIVTLLKGIGLTKRYTVKGKAIVACSDCDIEIRAGEVCALIGESGSGKTTVAEILSGILRPDAGTVVFNGQPVSGNSATSKIGWYPDRIPRPLFSY